MRLLRLHRRMARRDRWSRKKLLAHQADELEKLRAHAYAKSSFYRRFHAGSFEKPLSELPVLTKRDLMAHWDEVATDPSLKLKELQAFIEGLVEPVLFRGKYVIAATSGTTGVKGVFAFAPDEWLQGVASHGRINAWADFDVGLLRRLRMAVVSSTKPWCKSLLVGASVDTPILPTLRLDSTEPPLATAAKLDAFRPDILIAYAETAKALAAMQLEGAVHIAPRAVFTSSEPLTVSAQRRIREAWGIEPFNAYASTETALLAADCERHRMHLAEDCLIVEVVDRENRPVPAGTYGDKLLVTVLFSRTVPLIRYELSDRVALAGEQDRCGCGRPFAVVAGIQGRIEDTMRLAGARGETVPISSDVFHDVLEPAPIAGWQVEQTGAASVTVSVLGPQTGYAAETLAKKLTVRLREQGAQDPEVKLRIVEKLEQSSSGKTPLVKALIQRVA